MSAREKLILMLRRLKIKTIMKLEEREKRFAIEALNVSLKQKELIREWEQGTKEELRWF